MTTTVRLLATYNGNSPQTIVRLPDALAAQFVAAGNASLDLTGGINLPPPPVARVVGGGARLIYSEAGALLGIGDSNGNLILNSSGATTPVGATVPGAPTSLTLTAAAGAVIGAFTAPASTGGDPIQWYELTLSNGTVVRGDASPIAAAAPAGTAVTGVVRAVNGVGPSLPSNTSNSATPTGAAPSVPATAVTLTGPTSATVGAASSAYTVALSPVGGTVASPVTVTPAPVAGVTFAPTSVQLTTASPSATFTATASTAGTKSIAVTSTGGLTAPAAISLVVAASGVAPTVASQPAITGTPQQGVPLSITAATFNGTPAPTVTRTIKVAGVTVATGPQSSTNYTPSAGDVGKVPTVEATATNSEGSATTNVVSGAAIIAAAAGATLRQAATGSYLYETVSPSFHGSFHLPVTMMVAVPAGGTVRVKFTNKRFVNNVETDGPGTFTILAASAEVAGAIASATIGQAASTGGQTSYYEFTTATAIAIGDVVYLNYKVSNGSGLNLFPYFSHTTAHPTKQTLAGTNAGAPDQTTVVGGGSLTELAAGQAPTVTPTAIEYVHSGKAVASGGSSSSVGRNDGATVPGSGVQGYIARAVTAAGYPCKSVGVSGQRATKLAVSDTWTVSELAGITHYIHVCGGNDVTDGDTNANIIAAINTHFQHVKAAYPSMKIMLVALTPVVTGGGPYSTLASQTPHSTSGVRVGVNNSFKTAGTIPLMDAFWDVNQYVENNNNPEDSKFKIDAGIPTSDGIHLSSIAAAAAANSPEVAAFLAT